MKILETAGIVLGVLAAFSTFCYTNWKWWAKKAWQQFYDHFRAKRDQQYNFLLHELREIKAEVKTNGGSSLKDVVLKQADRLTKIDNNIENLKIGQRNTREIMDIPYWESDEDGKITFVSTKLCEMFGVTREELLDDSWIGFVAAHDKKRVLELWHDSVATASQFNECFDLKKGIRVCAVSVHNKDEEGNVESSLVRLNQI